MELSTGNSLAANVPGDQLFMNAAGNVFGALQGLYAALMSGNNIPAAVSEISASLSQVDSQRVFYGNALNQITMSENFLNQDKVNLGQQENTLVGADMECGDKLRAGSSSQPSHHKCRRADFAAENCSE